MHCMANILLKSGSESIVPDIYNRPADCPYKNNLNNFQDKKYTFLQQDHILTYNSGSSLDCLTRIFRKYFQSK